ncbi:hypothetical protein SmJEL517_g04905 [Synchytrium microbalum]|uniref:HNH nuclease domain-containing protein n=1 Tax=Synchytrium microbalum TaxID=1806994 RepID=A0A507C2V2_9FUNG|nr:uncharacterized protein SmJEL517_g04905 [Synchytrium microbalum]TPX31865.1 hypothetical protein SmJEL517_g04905 [Synchytrium microbalum]
MPPNLAQSVGERGRANLRVLKRYDKHAEEILDTFSYVAAYTFTEDTQSWTKRGIEGPMFVFRRSTSPYYAIFIMNRLDPENLWVLLDVVLEVELMEEFVVYRLADGLVQGLWMFEPVDRTRLEESLQTYCALALTKPPPLPIQPTSSTNASARPSTTSKQPQQPKGGQDLLAMLQRAASASPVPSASTESKRTVSSTITRPKRLPNLITDLSQIWILVEAIGGPCTPGSLDKQDFAKRIRSLSQMYLLLRTETGTPKTTLARIYVGDVGKDRSIVEAILSILINVGDIHTKYELRTEEAGALVQGTQLHAGEYILKAQETEQAITPSHMRTQHTLFHKTKSSATSTSGISTPTTPSRSKAGRSTPIKSCGSSSLSAVAPRVDATVNDTESTTIGDALVAAMTAVSITTPDQKANAKRSATFKLELAQRDGVCVLTGEEDSDLLIGAHVVPWSWQENHRIDQLPYYVKSLAWQLPKKLDSIENGLLLRWDLHAKFDKSRWTFFKDEKGWRVVVLAERVPLGIEGKYLEVPTEPIWKKRFVKEEFLRFHFETRPSLHNVNRKRKSAGERDYNGSFGSDEDGEEEEVVC